MVLCTDINPNMYKWVKWLLLWGARNAHPYVVMLSSRLALHDGVPGGLGDALRKDHVTAKYEDTKQQICKIYATNKIHHPDGIKDK